MPPPSPPSPFPLVLASASPRRTQLLAQVGVAHEVRPVDADESARPGESPRQLVVRLARDKALAGLAALDGQAWVLGADTIVVLDGRVFGKPAGRQQGLAMLQALAGRTHQVLTAVALAGPRERLEEALSCTDVAMRKVSAAEAAAYWDSGEPAGKAGGYAVQGRAALFIEHIAGSYSGVMGLPLYETGRLLQRCGLLGEAS